MVVDSETSGLGNDGFNRGSTLRLAFYLLILGPLFLWIVVNLPSSTAQVTVYTLMLILSMLGFIVDRLMKRREFIDTILEEGQERRPFFFDRISTQSMVVIFILISFVFFFSMVQGNVALVSSPTFAVVPFADSVIWLGFLSGIVGMAENFFFFGFLFPSVNAIASTRLGTFAPIASMPMAVLTFFVYHWLVYGPTDQVASMAVIVGGSIFVLTTFFFRSLLPADLIHFTNNFGSKVIPQIGGLSAGVIIPF